MPPKTKVSLKNVTFGDLNGENSVGISLDSLLHKRRKANPPSNPPNPASEEVTHRSGTGVPESRSKDGQDVNLDESESAERITDGEPGGVVEEDSEEEAEFESGGDSDLQLPSGAFLAATLKFIVEDGEHTSGDQWALLKKGIIFLHQPHELANILEPDDVGFLQKLIPSIPTTSPNFNETLEAHKAFISTNNATKLPTYPSGLSAEESDEWFYIHAAVIHLYVYLMTVTS